MKIFTSYYGNLKKLNNENITPLSVSLYNPKWFRGTSLKMLAPTRKMIMDDDITEEIYTEMFKKMLSKENVKEIVELIEMNSKGQDVALLCYERPGDFCHRHLIAEWLNEKTNFNVTEFVPKKKEVIVEQTPINNQMSFF